MESTVISKVERFRYLESIIQGNGEIDEDINQQVKIGWQKWKNASGVLCDKKITLRLKGRVYHMIVRPTLLYGAECWPIKKSQLQRMRVAEMRMIRWMYGHTTHTRSDRIRNGVIGVKIGVTPIKDKIRDARLR